MNASGISRDLQPQYSLIDGRVRPFCVGLSCTELPPVCVAEKLSWAAAAWRNTFPHQVSTQCCVGKGGLLRITFPYSRYQSRANSSNMRKLLTDSSVPTFQQGAAIASSSAGNTAEIVLLLLIPARQMGQVYVPVNLGISLLEFRAESRRTQTVEDRVINSTLMPGIETSTIRLQFQVHLCCVVQICFCRTNSEASKS